MKIVKDMQFFYYCRKLSHPGNPEFCARADFEFVQRVTLGTSNMLAPRFPWPGTLTNHVGVSDKGGAKSVAVLLTGYGKSLIYWLARLVWIRPPLCSSDWS